MRHRVRRKQHSSTMCLVCGTENRSGLQASFYELENGELAAVYRPRPEHQGYPGRLHGGVAAALLDETMGRAIMIDEEQDYWGVTLEVTTRFRKPVPLDREVRVVGRITSKSRRIFEGRGEILLGDGTVAVEGRGKYLKLPVEEISGSDLEGQWRVVPAEDDPEEIEI